MPYKPQPFQLVEHELDTLISFDIQIQKLDLGVILIRNFVLVVVIINIPPFA